MRRGIAVALRDAGWIVYVTARSSAAGRTGHLPGTVEETAAAVTVNSDVEDALNAGHAARGDGGD